ncbi:hypothetical protein [Streptomyces spiramyceticus]|uniref:hypothetical protein n=1 Tax=Streptomyces spiramyceticus TaxID=299717 RepID=UPI00237B7870|nr:hypothetical protein [Streptomyces spiramyceticus]
MSTPLPRRAPGDSTPRRTDSAAPSDWEPFGTPSPGLRTRSEKGLERFLRRDVVDGGDQAEESAS